MRDQDNRSKQFEESMSVGRFLWVFAIIMAVVTLSWFLVNKLSAWL